MYLKDLILALKNADQEYIAPIGFKAYGSWRGDYSQIAFEPAKDIPVSTMLAVAESALGQTLCGYKGAEYRIINATRCYMSFSGQYEGSDEIGDVLVFYFTGKWQGSGALEGRKRRRKAMTAVTSGAPRKIQANTLSRHAWCGLK